jgi:hypothetical protein
LPVLAALAVAVIGHLCTHGVYHGVAGTFARLPAPLRVLVLLGAAILVHQVSSTEAQPFIYTKF